MPSDETVKTSDITVELYTALERIGAPRELLAIVGSWGDTMGDAETLDHIRAFNATGTIYSEVVCQADQPSAGARQDGRVALRMVREAIGELFGPSASIESEEATLRRGTDLHHEAEAIVEALQRVANVQASGALARDTPVVDISRHLRQRAATKALLDEQKVFVRERRYYRGEMTARVRVGDEVYDVDQAGLRQLEAGKTPAELFLIPLADDAG